MDTVRTEKYLNDLLEKTYDAQRGYAYAAEVINHVQLKRWLAQQGARRTEFAAVLFREIKGMNNTPELDGSFTGDTHRGWMNIKAALSLHKDEAVPEECLTGEKYAIQEYHKVLEHNKEMPPSIISILEAQKDEMQLTVNEISSLADFAHDHHL
ncbi:PA2169 family four-helix-bundle protein [Nonlabens sp. Ci31]|uniref:ferritin-like domain-containing protein n=1 Tax=Nonlabens sp. Ci31 TaxID=2608253 RepID=UPI0014645E6E|nr:PA2169 family four-helix-bundle protein [Nonlabens sp. Ci31]QJP33213.1 PA2169 family four-helix-bundle protein [Nonlabens sp. Ci31]